MARLLDWSMADLVKAIDGRINNKFSAEIVIDGNRGLGKSTLAYKILTRLTSIRPFKPFKDIVYSQEETLRQVATKKKSPIMIDEGINVIYNRDFWSETQKKLLKGFNMYRDSMNATIICLPTFADLDVQLRELISMRLTVLRRGVALIQLPKTSLYTHDKWDVKYNQKIESKWSDSKTKNPKYGQLTTAVGILKFGDLMPKQRAEYEAIKEERRGKVFGEYNTTYEDSNQTFYKGLIAQMKQGRVTPTIFDVVCKANNRDSYVVRKILNTTLAKANDSKRCKDYIMSEKKRERMDALGFNVESVSNVEETFDIDEPNEVANG